ncbi:1-deoxypentalenic acid 11-beta-hydroxylase-like [Mytilus edulis]|uniref:1-deoxypentalenic acid 11-beta-hydroxylase-like n=1 Tax=Mytilus edulis TaxID=6550 RepID=UPI0039EE95EE
MSETKVIYSGSTDEACPELFNIQAKPPAPKDSKKGQLPDELIRQFFEEGYLVVDDFFTREELDACREDLKLMVEELAQKLHNAGKTKKLYRDYGLFERLTMIEKEFPGSNILLHKMKTMPKSFCDLWSNERILNVMEQILGPDIKGHPVWNIRTKTPQNEATTVPWHQDVGYLNNESYKVLQPTAWIPLLDTNEDNGCLQVAKRGHKTGKIADHQCCHGGTWYVMLEEEEMKRKLDIDLENDLKICPIPYGGMLLFNNLVPHRSLPNMSNKIRWSLDLRWQRPSEPVGFYGLKDGILMRTSKDPNYKIDWESFNKIDRHQVQKESIEENDSAIEDEFDTTIQGPWMKKWEIVHVNRHILEHRKKEGNPETWTKA